MPLRASSEVLPPRMTLTSSGHFNFVDSPCNIDAILPAETCARLGEVKRKWDPDGVIIANHAVALDPAA